MISNKQEDATDFHLQVMNLICFFPAVSKDKI